MESPVTPQKKGSKRVHEPVITSPYFPDRKTKRTIKLELDHPVSPHKEGFLKQPHLMTFLTNSSMEHETDLNSPCGIPLSQDDIEDESRKLADTACAFQLHMSVYLKYKLQCAKPILIQEKVADNPWKLLVAVTLLNKTAGKCAIPVLWRIMENWPSPETLRSANVDDLRNLIQPLGLHDTRAKRLIKLSARYVANPPRLDKLYPSRAEVLYVRVHEETQRARAVVRTKYPPTPISHLPGVGAYALDSYRIFCAPDDEWKQVLATDKELIRYLKWRWAFEEGCRWEPDRGVVGPLDEDYLEALPFIINP